MTSGIMTKNPLTSCAAAASLASVALNSVLFLIAILAPNSLIAKKIVDALGAPGNTLGQWLHLPLGLDMVPFFVGSFLFYLAIFWGVLSAWPAARARFGTGRA
jgi:hypothetical protein